MKTGATKNARGMNSVHFKWRVLRLASLFRNWELHGKNKE